MTCMIPEKIAILHRWCVGIWKFTAEVGVGGRGCCRLE